MTDRAYSLLGLCMRAGRLVTGEEPCVNAVRAGTAKLVLLDGAASANARKALSDACAYRSVPLLVTEPGRLGQAVGKRGRMAIAITDEGFAKAVRNACGEQAEGDPNAESVATKLGGA